MGGIPGGEGGDHQLRETDGQGAHRGGGNGRSAATAKGDDPVDFPFRIKFKKQLRRGLRHGGDALAPVLPRDDRI